ncbi:MAG TPA: arylsulfatase [Abditibacteriaceae bacterium]|nr:arylsulfatase [Abditibacteriaceae bacterium]
MPDKRPNILLILTDQQRGDCLGIEGHPVLQTPNLDWLARSGTWFRRGYSECPSCIPARRVLMSGQEPAVNGMVGFTGGDWHPAHTLAGELSRAGYQTEMIGKLHLFPYRKRYGFDHVRLSDASHGMVAEVANTNDYIAWLAQGGAVPLEAGVAHGVSANGWVGRPHYLPEHQTHSFWCVSQAVEFIYKRDPSAPFFLNVSFIDPHPPLTPPQLYYDRYITRDLPMPVVGDWAPPFAGPEKGLDINASILCLDEDAMRCARAAYYGMINHVDDQVGRLINYLQRQNLFHNTFILFTSDHGEMLGDHNMFRKTFAYEASARVPFFARAAATMNYPAEVVTSLPVGLQDVMPTLLDVAGVPIPETVTGCSLLPLLRGEPGPWRDVLHGEHAGCYRYEDGMHYLTDGHFKYVWYSQTGREHLFDLDDDPQELHDLSRSEDAESRLSPWRTRLAATLKERPEGFSDGARLIAGRPHHNMVPGAA